MLTRLGCAVITLLLALGAAGCGDDEPSGRPAPPSASPTAPPGLDTKVPTPPGEMEETEESAEEYSRYVAAVAQHSIRIHDVTPIAALARDQATCDSCRGLSDYIEGLKKDGLWEIGDDLEVGELRVRTGKAPLYQLDGPATYPSISFVDVEGEEQSKTEDTKYLFEADLVWDADRTRWQVEDYSLINKGKTSS